PPHAAVGRIPVQPDEERLAHQVLLRYRTPVAAVVAVVAVVAHHEVVPFRHHELSFDAPRTGLNEYPMLRRTEFFEPQTRAGHYLTRTNPGIDADRLLLDRFAVDIKHFVIVGNVITGQPDHALDVIDGR